MNAKDKLTKHETEALLHVLGTLDGLLEPCPMENIIADQQTAQHYADGGGLVVGNPGYDPARRKAHDRAMAGLHRRGLIERAGREVELTDKGHEHARRLEGLPTLTEALDLLAAIVASPARWTPGDWVSCPTLTGMDPAALLKGCRIPRGRLALLLYSADALVLARLIVWRPWNNFCLYKASSDGMERHGEGDAARWFERIEKAESDPPLSDTYGRAWDQAYRSREHAKKRFPNRICYLDSVSPPRGG